DLTVLYGGIEAERLLLDDISTGAAGSDLVHATQLAHFIIEMGGMGTGDTGLRQFRDMKSGQRLANLSHEQLNLIDRQVTTLITEAQQRAAQLLRDNRASLEVLRDLLIEKKTIDAMTIREAFAGSPGVTRMIEEEKGDGKDKKTDGGGGGKDNKGNGAVVE